MEKLSLSEWCKEKDKNILLEEWDYNDNVPITPDSIAYNSREEVHWICSSCKNSWKARINARTMRNAGCDKCAHIKAWETKREKLLSKHNLQTDYPELCEEWDYELNNGKTPNQYTKASHEEIIWKCLNGHPSYKVRIANRVYKNDGCPICGGRKILVGYNDLATVNPFLAEQWDYQRNYPKTPQEVFPREANSYWWICPICNESFLASVSNRGAGKNHKKCSQKGTSFPEQAIYYYVHGLFPDAINRHESFGFELDIYIPSIHSAVEYDGVRYHSGEASFVKDNNKDNLCQKRGITLYRFRDDNLPRTKSAIHINCKDGRNVDMDNSSIELLLKYIAPEKAIDVDVRRDYYKILSFSLLAAKEKSIIYTHPDLAKEWHPTKNLPLTPDKITAGMGTDIWWKCSKCQHEWQAVVYSRKNGRGCPECGKDIRAKKRRTAAVKKNNLIQKYPLIAAEWDYKKNKGIDIHSIAAGTKDQYYWICPKGHESYPASVNHRISGTGCPECGRISTTRAAGRKVVNVETGEVFNSLKEAGEKYGGNNKSIYNACNKPSAKAYGYHWKYVDESVPKRRSKALIKNMDTGEVFDSIQSAADKYNCDRSSISAACNGKTKTSQGYHWAFIE